MNRCILLLVIALFAAPTTACDGYAELPLPVREQADLIIESVDLHPGAAGLIQVAVELPEDVTGPIFVVVPPLTTSDRAATINWAVGACPTLGADQTTARLRLCLAVETIAGGEKIEPFSLQGVIEAWGPRRRFNVSGEVTP